MTIRSAVETSRNYIGANTGVRVETLTVFAFSDLDSVASAYVEWFGMGSRAVAPLRQRWEGNFAAEAGYRVVFIHVGSQTMQNVAHTVSHEVFHVAQMELIGRALSEQAQRTPPAEMRVSGANWLMEGSAQFVASLVVAATSGTSPDVERLRRISEIRSLSFTLAAMEIPAGFQAVPSRFGVGHVASEFLLRSRGLPALAAYYSAIGQGTASHAAFELAFGIPPEEFYRAFEEYRARGYR